jgi:hypothetical protein
MTQTTDVNQAARIEFPGTPLAYRVTAIKPNQNKIYVICDYRHNEGRATTLPFRGTVQKMRGGEAMVFK